MVLEMYVRLSLALAAVWGDVLWSSEDLESWVSLDAIVLAKVLLFGAVNLCKSDVLLLEGRRSLLVLWRQRLAVTAPWCKDCILVNDPNSNP